MGFCFGSLIVSGGCPIKFCSWGGVFLSLTLCVPSDWLPVLVTMLGVVLPPGMVSCVTPLGVFTVVIVLGAFCAVCLVALWTGPSWVL